MSRPRATAWTDADLQRAAAMAAAPGGSLRKAHAATGISLGTIRNYITRNPEYRHDHSPRATQPDAEAEQIARECLVKLCRGIDLTAIVPTGIDPNAVHTAFNTLVDRIDQGSLT